MVNDIMNGWLLRHGMGLVERDLPPPATFETKKDLLSPSTRIYYLRGERVVVP